MPRPKTFNREKVLESATKVFWKQGYAGTSMKDLELATSLTPGSIYHEFESKQGLFEQSLQFYVDNVITWRVKHYLKEENSLQGVREFLLTSVKNVPQEFYGQACLATNSTIELGTGIPTVNTILAKSFRVIENGLHTQLLAAQNQNDIRKDLNCKKAAHQLLLLMSGLMVASKANTRLEKLEESIDFTLDCFT